MLLPPLEIENQRKQIHTIQEGNLKRPPTPTVLEVLFIFHFPSFLFSPCLPFPSLPSFIKPGTTSVYMKSEQKDKRTATVVEARVKAVPVCLPGHGTGENNV